MTETLSAGKGKLNTYKTAAENIVFPALLFIFPLLLMNQGIDITDTTYSLSNYRFMEQMDMMWVLATYLANITGSLLMKLPFGDTMLGINLYTGLIVSALALFSYVKLRKRIPCLIVFFGELIALCLCWSPTTAIYHYLTYALFTMGSLFLYEALCEEKKRYYVYAGICLGLNVMVRFPNLTEAALILAVWFAGWIRKEKPAETAVKTGYCLAGYLAAAGSVLLVITVKYGAGAFAEMIGGLFGMTAEASDYTAGGMLTLIGNAYAYSLKWMAYMIPCILAGILMFHIRKGYAEQIKKMVFLAGMLILLRFYWGRGMFSFRYYNEGSVFQWMMFLLITAILLSIAQILGFLADTKEDRILACIVLVIIIITPLGSNNYTYANMNNLFVAAPYTIWIAYRLLKKTKDNCIHFPWQAFLVLNLLMVLIQGIGFGCTYVFKDGINGEKRNYQVANSAVLKGMYTTEENAQELTALLAYASETEALQKPVLFWGEIPGLSYILDVPSAIYTTWPEAPSNTYASLNEALLSLTDEPAVILYDKELENGELQEADESAEAVVLRRKKDLILDYIASHDYQCTYNNKGYRVYQIQEETEND